MKKKISFIIISIVITTVLFTTAATCNLCAIQPGDETQTEQKQESTKQQSRQTSGTSQDKEDKSQDTTKDSSDSKSSDSSSKTTIEITDIVVGDVIDEHVEPADFLFTDSTYTCYPVLASPPDGIETYDWSVSGGSSDNGAYYMQWETPPDEGTYTISLDIIKDDGSSGTFSKDVFVEFLFVEVEPPQAPTIIDIEISGDTADGKYLANTIYRFNVSTTESFDMIDQYIITVTSGTVLSQLGGIMEWESPNELGDCIITANILDIDGNIMDTMSKVMKIERFW